MKISYQWLQKYFDAPLPSVEELSRAITFHAFEIDGVEEVEGGHVLDVKVLPDRSHDCLSHRGIAKEVSAILDIPLRSDPLKDTPTLEPKTGTVSISIENQELCNRYIAGVIRGVKVGPSPVWLQQRLAALGQRSINNVVDATNFVMFNMGQPLHAFDAAKITDNDGRREIGVRYARAGEKMIALDGKEYTLTETMLVIADMLGGRAIGIAGVKGGEPAAITEATTDIIIESANFYGPSVRRTSAALHLRTDASTRFENVISPELAAFGMHAAVAMIRELAGGSVEGFADVYPKQQDTHRVHVTAADVTRIFGIPVKTQEVEAIMQRFGWSYAPVGGGFDVTVPVERLDMRIPEDVVADIGRIYGYEHIPSVPPPPLDRVPEINKHFYYIDRIRGWLIERGFSEVYTSVFTLDGKHQVLNKVGSDTPYLRSDLWPSLQEALETNYRNRDLLGISDVRLFEIGTVWTESGEKVLLALGVMGGKGAPQASEFLSGLIKEFDIKVPGDIPSTPIIQIDLDSLIVHAPDPLAYQDLPVLGPVRYQPFSRYPFIVRDIALWVPKGESQQDIHSLILKSAGDLVVRSSLFDTFEKGEKVSYAFRLVFQANDRTLTDEEVNAVMEEVTKVLVKKGYEIR